MNSMKEYVRIHSVNPDNCDLYWLAGMTAEEWRKLPWVEKVPHMKEWGRYWPIMRARVKRRREDRENTSLVDRYKTFEGSGGKVNLSSSWSFEGSDARFK